MPRSGHRGGRGLCFVSGYRPFGVAVPYSTSVPEQKDERILVNLESSARIGRKSVDYRRLALSTVDYTAVDFLVVIAPTRGQQF